MNASRDPADARLPPLSPLSPLPQDAQTSEHFDADGLTRLVK